MGSMVLELICSPTAATGTCWPPCPGISPTGPALGPAAGLLRLLHDDGELERLADRTLVGARDEPGTSRAGFSAM